MRNFHLPGRSAIYCQEAALATSHPLATAAGIDVLKRGGNAADAAICAAAVLGVVEPEQSGIGGDCFTLVARPGRNVIALNGAGWAPREASREWYVDNGFQSIPFEGPHSVTVPGAVDAWCRLLADFGTWGLSEILAPAIGYAEGHPVHERVSVDWTKCIGKLSADPYTADIFLPEGQPPAPGAIFRQPRLARSLSAIAAGGRDAFYSGEIAEDIVARLRVLGGLHKLDDFAEYRAQYVEPLGAAYANLEVLQCPPSGQGFTTLAMLRLLETLGTSPDADPLSAKRLHIFAEAAKIAYAARDGLIGDSPESQAEAEAWLEPDNIAEWSKRIDPVRARGAYPASSSANTTYVTAIDRDRTMVSLISSIYQSYGSCLTSPKSGIVLQDRGAGFSLAEGHPNVIAGRKRPLHTIIPGLALRNRNPAISFGMVGGHFQPFGQCWLLSNMVDYGMTVQEAIDLPRAFAFDGAYRLEGGIPQSTAAALDGMGHRTERWPLPLGSAQVISVNWASGIIAAGSDGRTDGCAAGF
jgi:gamma-glutamyltranspeptidase/glutathione hydrolase